ncbi:MAG: PAS domain S-box protein [Candidatus Heimdallarchaeota archaeon]
MSHVLLVDDDENILRLAQQFLILEEPTFTLATATSAQEALQQLEEEDFDVVVSDYRMPETDGLAFLKTLRNEGNSVPFIIFTGQGREEVAMDALNLGADYYLMKSTEIRSMFGELAHIIRQVVEHRRIQEALQESEKRFRLLAENAQDLIYRIEFIPAIKFAYVSPSATVFNGYSPEEHYADPQLGFKIVHPDDRHLLDLLPDPSAVLKQPVEVRWICKDGRTIWTEQRLNRTFDEAGNLIAIEGIARDISDRKQMIEELKERTAALHESEKKHRELIEHLHEGVWAIDKEANTTFVNSSMAKMLGYTPEEMLNKHLFSFMDDKAIETAKYYLERRQQGIEEEHEFEFLRKDGSRVDTLVATSPLADTTGTYIGAVAGVLDITERKQAVAALQESEENLRNLFDTISEGVIIITPEGQITEANPAACHILGLTRSEITDRNYVAPEWAILRPDGTPMPPEEMAGPRAMLEKRSVKDVVMGVQRPDSIISWINVNATPYLSTSGELKGVVGTFVDITARNQAEQKLRISEHRLAMAVEASGAGVYDHAVPLNEETYHSERWAEILGYTREELPSFETFMPWLVEQIHSEDVPKLEQAYAEFLRNPQATYDVELRVKHKTGTWIYVQARSKATVRDENGNAKHIVGVMLDITERKRAEEALRRSEQKHLDLFHSAPAAYFSVGTNGTIKDCNQAAEDFTGYSLQELQNMKVFDLYTEESKGKAARLLETFKQGVSWTNQEMVYERKDGRKAFGLLSVNPIKDENGQVLESRSVVVDISPRYHAQELLKQQKEELSDFVQAMAHDIRNRLIAIKGYADLLQKGHDETYAERIGHLAMSMDNLLTHSVALADAGQIIEKSNEVELGQLVWEVSQLDIPNSVVFASDTLPTIKGDRQKLFQVFQNLFQNAIIHGNPSKIKISSLDSEEGITLLISNDGTPIPDEARAKIFQRGFTTKEDGGGLGLTIVKRLIEAHGWQIALEGTTETTFGIHIPMK